MPTKVRRDSGENEIIAKNNEVIKKQKVNSDDFTIPKYEEYEWLNKYNYTLNQLRSIARHYKLVISGNKGQLIERTASYLKKSVYSTKIQRVAKGYLQRLYNKTHGPAFLNRSLCNNVTDFYSMDDISEIPLSQFFSYKDQDSFIYGFDILSLYNLILTNGKDAFNPYNRNILPNNIIDSIRHKIRLSHVLKIPITITINNTPFISSQKRHELRVLSLFQEIDSLGNYSNSEWFMSLDRGRLIKYLRELLDIWTYRAQLSSETKLQICPPNGDPLRNTNISLIYNLSTESLQRFILGTMENLVKTGINQDSKSLGAYYVLAALTLVNNEAAEAMPWLYHSVVHI
jgi:hypothetical protein